MTFPKITAFLAWLSRPRITDLGQVTAEHLDRYLDDVASGESGVRIKSSLLFEVHRLWS